MGKKRILVLGAGARGNTYSHIVHEFHRERAEVVGVADPRREYRQPIVDEWNLGEGAIFDDWRDAAARPKFADAVFICTQDAMHRDPAVEFARQGYHILLEKPIAPTEQECRDVARAVADAGVMAAVCHVLRYTAITRTVMRLLAEGRIGDVIGIQRLESVCYWHYAHAFVRGQWRNEAESSFMLLAKSCHDMDWMRMVMGSGYSRVSSFGALRHFRAEERPEGAADRCVDCGVEDQCPYSAKRFYLSLLETGHDAWPLDVITAVPTRENVLAALREGPFGRCVYACDNDVVDHQVVNMEFANAASGAFTMSAFTPAEGRMTRLFGSRGHMRIRDEAGIELFDFMTDKWETVPTDDFGPAAAAGGHGGGDGGLIEAFVNALVEDDPSTIKSGMAESLETHLAVFAAERARKNGTVEAVG